MNLKAQIPLLQAGQILKIRPKGNSMTGRINSGQLVTIEPITDHNSLQKGDIVLCKVNGNVYLHLISAIVVAKSRGPGIIDSAGTKAGELRFQISNNHGYVNGWTLAKNVYGKVIAVEP